MMKMYYDNIPYFVEVNNKRYKINTDYRVAIRCIRISKDNTINDYERALGIVYMLFGDIDDNETELLRLGIKYLQLGKEYEENNNATNEEPYFDMEQDFNYIRASFRSDYNIDIDKEEIHWWAFNYLLDGLTDDCILSKVISIRCEDLSEHKGKDRDKWVEMKKKVALKKEKTQKEIELDDWWKNQLRKE